MLAKVHKIKHGGDMQRLLNQMGIPATTVVKHRQSASFNVEFFVPEMQLGVRPAKQWTDLIDKRFTNLKIIKSSDTVATWRDNQPIIIASIELEDHGVTPNSGEFKTVSLHPEEEAQDEPPAPSPAPKPQLPPPLPPCSKWLMLAGGPEMFGWFAQVK